MDHRDIITALAQELEMQDRIIAAAKAKKNEIAKKVHQALMLTPQYSEGVNIRQKHTYKE